MASENYFPGSGGGGLSAAVIVRRSLFFLLLLWLVIFYLFLDFQGLSTAEGMDQAQIAREIARGNGFETKVIRPLALFQLNKGKQSEEEFAPFVGLLDTYSAPLNPLLNSIALKLVQSKWEFDIDDQIYFLDRVIVIVSTMLFLASVGITYLLLARIFDARIAGVTAILLLFCDLLWGFARSGLPQMLMLFLFMFAMYFLYKAIENQEAGRSPSLWIALCGGFLGLLALAQWLGVWLLLGLLVFVAIHFRPRGVNAVILVAVFMVIMLPWVIRNLTVTGTPLGAGIYGLYNGLAGGVEGVVMRNFDPEKNPLPTDGMLAKMIYNSLLQLENLYALLGSVVVAPLFFLSLLHPFRRPEIAAFRWAILAMWLPAVLGMSLFGLSFLFDADATKLDPNQLHMLFIPLMAGYGLAFLSVLWARLGLPSQIPMLRNGHIILVIAISVAPLLLTMPRKTVWGVRFKGRPHWPPYIPAAISRLGAWSDGNEVIVTDVPWAVAWYADRISLWLPSTQEQFENLSIYGRERGTPVIGVFLTPVTTDARLGSEIMRGEYKDWARLILRGELFRYKIDLVEPEFPFRYVQPMPANNQSFFYADSRRWLVDKEGEP